MAKFLREMYVALLQEGFTAKEALAIIAEVVKTSIDNANKDGT